jgi:oxygen-dependent protoporphyrinogen oxidase
VAAGLLRPLDAGLGALLDGIGCASAATVSLGYRRADIPHPLDGFGFVVPRTEGRALLACTFASVKYPGRAADGLALLRGFVGGALDAGMLERSDGELCATVRAELREALGVTAEPRLVRVHRWPASMPQYHVGHLARVDAIARRLEAIPGVTLAGSAYRGVGISDCVHGGETAAERALRG